MADSKAADAVSPAGPPADASIAWFDGWTWLRVWLTVSSLLIAIRHGLRLIQVLRLAAGPVLQTWPWRVPWPWVAGASAAVLLAWLAWLVALVRWPVRAWKAIGWGMVAYVVWGWVETAWWTAADLNASRWAFVLGRGVLVAGLGWLASRSIVAHLRAQVAYLPKEAS